MVNRQPSITIRKCCKNRLVHRIQMSQDISRPKTRNLKVSFQTERIQKAIDQVHLVCYFILDSNFNLFLYFLIVKITGAG